MPKIETRQNKRLKLVNVIYKELPFQKFLVDESRHLDMIENYIKVSKYNIVGPLIVYNGPITGMDNNIPIMNSKIIVQVKEENIKVEEPYIFEKEIVVSNCLMARFMGKQEYLEYASNKLTIIAYEEEIELTGETYMVFVDQNEDESVIDIFMPVKGGE